MKVFNSIGEYMKTGGRGDRVILGGRGIIDGLKGPHNKEDVYTVFKCDEESLVVKGYRGRKQLRTRVLDQQIAVLNEREFQQLPVLN